MNLLIVDDEQLTREGIFESIDWQALGVHRVLLAEDGIEGVALARHFKPDIVLSDVRMPRLDGIGMAERIREFQPGCMIVFMSGYSDKEYLKSAIRLKAVSYVEKPIQIPEIESAVAEAVAQIKEMRESRQGRQLRESMEESRLALALVEARTPQDLAEQLHVFGLESKRGCSFTTVVVELGGDVRDNRAAVEILADHFGKCGDRYGCKVVHGVKNDRILLCHLYFADRSPYRAVERFLAEIPPLLRDVCPVFVAAGKSVSEPEKIKDSYNEAVSLLQTAFYLEESGVIEAGLVGGNCQIRDDFYEDFRGALAGGRQERCQKLLDELLEQFRKNSGTLPSYVRDVYGKLLHLLNDVAGARYVNLWHGAERAGTITDAVAGCRFLRKLHELLLDKTAFYFELLAKKSTEDSMVSLIQGYIIAHIDDSLLSIRSISDYTGLSTSYVCTLYKNETGETLNHFITGVRIDRAKQLLRDPRLRIGDIAALAGYSDSNYFAKLFKKKTGFTPSEYRESNL